MKIRCSQKLVDASFQLIQYQKAYPEGRLVRRSIERAVKTFQSFDFLSSPQLESASMLS